MHSVAQARALFGLYALGTAAISLEILLLNARAWHLREPLRLNARERVLTLGELSGWGIPIGVGLVSLLLALTLPLRLLSLSGWLYFLMSILLPLHHKWIERKAEAAEAEPQGADNTR